MYPGGVGIFLVSVYYRNQVKLWPDETLVCRLFAILSTTCDLHVVMNNSFLQQICFTWYVTNPDQNFESDRFLNLIVQIYT